MVFEVFFYFEIVAVLQDLQDVSFAAALNIFFGGQIDVFQ